MIILTRQKKTQKKKQKNKTNKPKTNQKQQNNRCFVRLSKTPLNRGTAAIPRFSFSLIRKLFATLPYSWCFVWLLNIIEFRFLPFYRGLSASLMATIPHAGVDLAAYETFKNGKKVCIGVYVCLRACACVRMRLRVCVCVCLCACECVRVRMWVFARNTIMLRIIFILFLTNHQLKRGKRGSHFLMRDTKEGVKSAVPLLSGVFWLISPSSSAAIAWHGSDKQLPGVYMLLCAGAASTLGQTIAYPFHLVKTRYIAQGSGIDFNMEKSVHLCAHVSVSIEGTCTCYWCADAQPIHSLSAI